MMNSFSNASHVPMPKLIPIRQQFPRPRVHNIAGEIARLIREDERSRRIRPGHKIAVAVGSRGIRNIDTIVKSLLAGLKELGARPFIVPAMGSHGGATAEGQRQVLADYGISEETMDVPVESSMDVDQIGELENGMPVYLDKAALASDGIIVVNRIKPHTGFKGDYESGLLKMIAIGLGKHKGASAFHTFGFDMFPTLIPQLGQYVIQHAPLLFGLAILENAYDETAHLELVWKENLIAREKELLQQAKELMPRILVDNIHVLIIHEFGKDISGAGMDSNITGRSNSRFFDKPDALSVDKMVVLNLTKASCGNATGIGIADVTTKKLVDSMDLSVTYTNAITSTILTAAKIPVYMKNDLEAIQTALQTAIRVKHPDSRIVWIRNTLQLEDIYVSESFLSEVAVHPQIQIKGEAIAMQFSEAGDLLLPA